MEELEIDIENLRQGPVTNDIFVQEDKRYITVFMLADHARLVRNPQHGTRCDFGMAYGGLGRHAGTAVAPRCKPEEDGVQAIECISHCELFTLNVRGAAIRNAQYIDRHSPSELIQYFHVMDHIHAPRWRYLDGRQHR